MNSVRTWGDGGNDQRVHVIEDITFSATPNRIRCRCEAVIEATGPDALAAAWGAHGGKVFSGRGFEDRSDMHEAPVEDAAVNMEAFIAVTSRLAERCTCATTPVTECPNYVAGDEVAA